MATRFRENPVHKIKRCYKCAISVDRDVYNIIFSIVPFYTIYIVKYNIIIYTHIHTGIDELHLLP